MWTANPKRSASSAFIGAILALLATSAFVGAKAHGQGIDALEKDVIRLVQRVRPACVSLRVQDRRDPAIARAPQARRLVERARLSGTVWDTSGTIATIVTVGADLQRAERVFVAFQDGVEYRAIVIGEDPETAVGLLRVEGATVPAVTWGDSTKLSVGSLVVTVGNPFGLLGTPSLGMVSGLERDFEDMENGPALRGMIQLAASQNPGDTGGPLANSTGEVVGILAWVFRRPALYRRDITVLRLPEPSEAPVAPELPPGVIAAPAANESLSSEGITFAYPVHRIRPTIEKLLKHPGPKAASEPSGPPWLGIQVIPIGDALAAQLGIDAESVLVADVTRNGPARRAGIEPFDVLLSLDGKPLTSVDTLIEVLNSLKPGAEVKATVRRNAKTNDVVIKLE